MQTLDAMCLHTVGWRLPGLEPTHSQPLLGFPAWYQVVLSWHGPALGAGVEGAAEGAADGALEGWGVGA